MVAMMPINLNYLEIKKKSVNALLKFLFHQYAYIFSNTIGKPKRSLLRNYINNTIK